MCLCYLPLGAFLRLTVQRMVVKLQVRLRAPEQHRVPLPGLDLDADVVVTRAPVRDRTVAI